MDKGMLKIAEGVSLPVEAVTQTIAILAKRRVGKSYTMRRAAEEFLEKNQQVVIVDPKGDQWGIRSSSNGKDAGYAVTILGGEHGDIPLEVGSGELVAKLVTEERVSVLLDLSLFRKHEVATFMTAFMENLYRLKAHEKYRTPLMLIIDEADAIAPQKPQKGEERMLGAAEDIVRRGGQRGLGCMLITQRSAVLNKNVLTQAEMLIVLRTIAPQDLAAMNAWIEVHGDIEQQKILMESLPSLPIGDAWFWSPGWPTANGIFKRSHVLPIRTFDSAATPKPGEKKPAPKKLAEVDLEVLKKQMAETIEKQKSEDPRLLKKRIAELEKAAPKREAVTKEVRVEVPVLKDSQIVRLEKIVESLAKHARSHDESIKLWLTEFRGAFEPILTARKMSAFPSLPSEGRRNSATPMSRPRADTRKSMTLEKPLSKGARQVLTYLHECSPEAKTKAQMWIATGYAPGGGFNNLVYELTGAGLIQNDGSGRYFCMKPTEAAFLDSSFDKSLDKWRHKLSKGAAQIFTILRNEPLTSFSKEELARMTGYALGGGFNNLIYELTGKELAVKEGIAYKINPLALDL